MSRHENLAMEVVNRLKRGGRLLDIKLLVVDILSREEATYLAEIVLLKLQLQDERKKNEASLLGDEKP